MNVVESVTKLQRLYKHHSVYRAVFGWLAERDENPTETRVDMAVKALGPKLTYRDLVAFFKKLENAGVGRFIVGRRGGRSRFEWTYTAESVGKAALGESKKLVALHQMGSEEPGDFEGFTDERDGEPEGEEDENEGEGLLRTEYLLRPDLRLPVVVPVDMTEGEANRLADFIRTLWFERK